MNDKNNKQFRTVRRNDDNTEIQIPVWGTCEECDDADHEIEIVKEYGSIMTEWACVKCGYIEWVTK